MKGTPPLYLALGRSPIAAAVVAVACLATAALVALLPGPALHRALIVVALGAHGVWTLRSWALRTARRAIVRLEVAADGEVVLCERSGRRRRGLLQPASYIGTRLTTVVVRLQDARWSHGVAILPDMISAEELRQLRVSLRGAGSAAISAASRATPRRR